MKGARDLPYRVIIFLYNIDLQHQNKSVPKIYVYLTNAFVVTEKYIYIQRQDCRSYDGIKVERLVQRMKKNKNDSTSKNDMV